MEGNIILKNTVLLFDSYSVDSQRLHDSFRHADLECSVIVLEDNDFLPKEVMSVYDLFLGYFEEKEGCPGKPRFFNEIEVPDQWSIHFGTEKKDYGSVTFQHEEKGRIYYWESSEKKWNVKAVDWFDRKGNVRFRDHYNRYGFNCARTYYGEQGKELGKSWFSAGGQEKIVQNAVTQEWMVNDGESVKFFRTKTDMMLYFCIRAGVDQKQVFYNTLAAPCQISYRLPAPGKRDVLFWQEDINGEIPGNMQVILNNQTARTCDRIIVQNKGAYNRLLEMGVDPDKVQLLGYIYDFKKKNTYQPQALICTHTERIEHCEELINIFPQIHFHIAAITQMSSNLMALGRYENVSLYEGVQKDTLESLFQLCDYYFDINCWIEIVSAVYTAFLHDQLIFAFEETVHNRRYVASEHIYPVKDFDRMVVDIRSTIESTEQMDRRLEMQHSDAMVEEKEAYIKIMNKIKNRSFFLQKGSDDLEDIL